MTSDPDQIKQSYRDLSPEQKTQYEKDLDVLRKAHAFRTWFQKAMATMFIGVMLLGIANLYFTLDKAQNDSIENQDNKDATITNRENGFKNRSITCYAIFNNPRNTMVPPPCQDPEVVKYYPPGFSITGSRPN